MPKETIGRADEPFVIRIAWGAGGTVQLGVETPGERSLFWQLLGEQVIPRLGAELAEMNNLPYEDDEARARALLDILDVVTSGGYKGIWAHLDRSECNSLIRTTRRARDATFGRDE